MKKLLSLLSVLTISGTAVPPVIAASPYQKEEENKIKNSEITLQESNLKKLKRVKRLEPISTTIAAITASLTASVGTVGTSSTIASAAAVGVATPFAATVPVSTGISVGAVVAIGAGTTATAGVGIAGAAGAFNPSGSLSASNASNVHHGYANHHNYANNNASTSSSTNINNSFSLLDFTKNQNYLNNIKQIIRENSVIFKLFGTHQHTGKYRYSLRKTNNPKDYIPISLKSRNGKEITVVLNPNSNLYLDGFISNDGNHKMYYHFSEAKIINIDGAISRSLGYNGDYPTLLNNELNKSIKINKSLINKSIDNLSSFTGNISNKLKDDLVRTIFMTSESMRFFSIQNEIHQILHGNKIINKDTGEFINREIDFKDYFDKLRKWDDLSKKYTKSIDIVKSQHIQKNIPKNQQPHKGSVFGRENPDSIVSYEYENSDGIIEVDHYFAKHEMDDVAILSSGSIRRLFN